MSNGGVELTAGSESRILTVSSGLQGTSLSWQDMDVIQCNILLTPFIRLSNDE